MNFTIVLIVSIAAVGFIGLVLLAGWLADRPERGMHAARAEDDAYAAWLQEENRRRREEIHHDQYPVPNFRLRPFPDDVPGPAPTAGDSPGPVSAPHAVKGATPPGCPAPGPGAKLVTHADTALWPGHPEPWFYVATYEEACTSRSGELDIHDDQWSWLAEGQYDRVLTATDPGGDGLSIFPRRGEWHSEMAEG